MGLVGNQTSASTAEHLLWLWEKAEITEMVEWMKFINHQISSVKADKEMEKKKKKKRSYIFNSRSVHINANSMNYGSGHVWLVVNLIGPLPGPLAVCF